MGQMNNMKYKNYICFLFCPIGIMLVIQCNVIGIHQLNASIMMLQHQHNKIFHLNQIESNKNESKKVYNIDQLKYIDSNYSLICDYNPINTSIKSGSHHKTGTHILNRKILPNIMKYWVDKCTSMVINESHLETKVRKITGKMDTSHMMSRNIFKTLKSHSNHQHLMILHIIRNPIDTILSGYNYHKRGDIGEHWLFMTPSQLKRRTNFCWEMNDILYNLDQTLLNEKILNIYNTMNLSIGIEIEYYRYIKCVFDEIYQSYYLIEQSISKYEDNNYIHLKNIKMEDLMSNFNQTGLSILDNLGIIHEIDRNNIINLLQQFDIKQTNTNITHITQGSYDKVEQINVLLSNIDRCQLLRNMTIKFNYHWIYNQYC